MLFIKAIALGGSPGGKVIRLVGMEAQNGQVVDMLEGWVSEHNPSLIIMLFLPWYYAGIYVKVPVMLNWSALC